MKLLIADDNDDMRIMLRDFCSGHFNIIDECSSGTEVVKLYSLLRPDYVLMDIKMPGLNGIDAAKMIIEKHPGAKIIMITNFNNKFHEEESLSAGAVKYISKDNLSELEKFFNQIKRK